ncbi:MAG TPA: flavodoxin family protein [Mycobacteriales bacterium]
MSRLLLVHHTPSPALQELFEAALAGTKAEGIEGVEVQVRPALTCSPVEVLECDGIVLGTPANIGYMSGALKHFFDQCYYPVLEAKRGIPYGLYVHGNLGVEGAVGAVEKIAGGLGWTKAADVVTVTGQPSKDDRDAVWNLAATVAASL